MSIDQRCHKMAYFIKFWLKHWRLIGADNGYISSYAVQIMIIAFCQGGIDPPLLPNLQEYNKDEKKHYKYYLSRTSNDVFQANCYFVSEYESLIEKMHQNHGVNKLSTAELVYKFFEFYSNEEIYEKLIDIKSGGFIPKLNKEDKVAFSILDPFQVEHNPGQSLKSHSLSYKTTVTKFEDLCQRVKEGRVIFDKVT